MSTLYNLPSSDPILLQKAAHIAETFASAYRCEGIVGIALLGALARGYFDAFADIDISIFTSPGAQVTIPGSYIQEQGFEIHCFLSDYAQEAAMPWDMAKRWAFSTHRIFYDPQGLLAELLEAKIVLQPEERKWLMIEGMAQSDWYANSLPGLWIARGSLISAHRMFDEGITFLLNALFGLNNQLVADVKWRYFCVEQLPILPRQFGERMREVMSPGAFSEADVERRRQAFVSMWEEILPLVEDEVQMRFDVFAKLV
jgi:hypothetical protein